MAEHHDGPSTTTGLGRRQLVRGAAWAAPVLVTSATASTVAASTTPASDGTRQFSQTFTGSEMTISLRNGPRAGNDSAANMWIGLGDISFCV